MIPPIRRPAGPSVNRESTFFAPADKQGHSDLGLYKFATGGISKILTIERDVGYRIAVSPGERTILYGQYDQAGSDLMLVENFR